MPPASATMARVRFTSSFSLRPCSSPPPLSQLQVHHPTLPAAGARHLPDNQFNPYSVHFASGSSVSHHSQWTVSRTCDTASFSELARRHNPRAFRRRIGSQSASWRRSRSRRVCLRVCLHSGHSQGSEMRSQHSSGHNRAVSGTDRGPVSVAVLLLFGRAPV